MATAFFHAQVPTAEILADIFGISTDVATAVHARVGAKLAGDPLEDVRIDFEDGYGTREGAEETRDVVTAATALAAEVNAGRAPRRVGLRIKSLGSTESTRALATLDSFLATYAASTPGAASLPREFVVTLPKVSEAGECASLAGALSDLEKRFGFAPIACEIMIETKAALLGEDGAVALPSLVRALQGRCIGVHLGSYDLTASLDVAAHVQSMSHPYCELARLLMKVAAPADVDVSDGATTELPLGKDVAAVRHALMTHFSNIIGSLERGIYQGWDLHPAQLTARYVATYSFFLRALAPMTARLKNLVERAGQATRVGTAFDDMATGESLYRFFRRGRACGALTDDEVRAAGLAHANAPSLASALASGTPAKLV